MVENLHELWRFRDLLRQLVLRELRVRYKNSVLGFFWSIIPPLLQVLVFSFFVKTALNAQAKNYSPYLLCGLIPWTFVTNAALDSSQSILVNFGIIKKVYLPREVIPIAIIISNFIHYLLGWAVYFVAFLVVLPFFDRGIPFRTTLLWFPLITIVALLFTTGLSLWVAALNVFYDDVKFILQTSFNLLIFLLPVIYPTEVFHEKSFVVAHPWLFHLFMLNPVTAVIDTYRKTLLMPVPQGSFGIKGIPRLMDPAHWAYFGGAAILSLLFAYSGYWYFNKRKWQFVERI